MRGATLRLGLPGLLDELPDQTSYLIEGGDAAMPPTLRGQEAKGGGGVARARPKKLSELLVLFEDFENFQFSICLDF